MWTTGRWVALTVAAVMAAAGVAGGTPTYGAARAAAPLAVGDRWGYVWANQPSTASYTPSLSYQANSSGAANTITRNGTGDYTVHFTNLGPFGPPTGGGGMVNVTAYGFTSDMCKVAQWFPSGSNLDARVLCFNTAGSPVDSLFTASFTGTLDNPGPFGFAWANNPSAAVSTPYTPALSYQFNSTGATNTVERFSPGRYAVFMPGLGGSTVGGTVLVTGYSFDNSTCVVTDWFTNGADLEIDVQCRNSAGAQADAFFTTTYARDTSTLGVPGAPEAYVLATQPTTASYTPPAAQQFNSTGAVNTIVRNGTGDYTVLLPGLDQNNGHVQVTTSAFGTERCKVRNWFASGGALNVHVGCFTAGGTPLDARFTASYTR